MSNKAIMFMGLLFGLFLVWLPNSSAESNYCKKVKKELDLTYERICGCPGYKLQFPKRSTKDYVKVTGVPDMTAITTCFWVKTTQSDGEPSYVSYAVGNKDNAFLIYSNNAVGKLYLRVMQGIGQTPLFDYQASTNIQVNDNKWHHVCATWQSQGGKYSIYKDGNLGAKGTLRGTIGATIAGGGVLVLGQDQDTVGGGFVTRDAFEGEMAEVNIWNSVLSWGKISEMSKSCRPSSEAEGNVKAWSDFQSGIIAGKIKKLKSACCNVDY